MGSPAVLVAMEAGQQHILICVHLAKAQRLVGVIADHIMAIDQLLSLRVSILIENRRVGGGGKRYGWMNRIMDGDKE